MKVLVFGQTGQVATELRSFEGVTCLARAEADLEDPGACEAIIAETDADAVVNAAAYTGVDTAENDRTTAMIVNAMAPTAMAAAAAVRKIPFVQISTDYVFDGSGSDPWQPQDLTVPLGVYGASKLGGERGVTGAGGIYAILRTSWVFSAHGGNFLKTMLRLAEERDTVSVVSDQVGGPTPARDIAIACMKIAQQLRSDPGKSGIYHFCGNPETSWADFARDIFGQAGLAVRVSNIATSEYPTPARRPQNSRLDCRETFECFGIRQPDWRAGVRDVLLDLNRD